MAYCILLIFTTALITHILFPLKGFSQYHRNIKYIKLTRRAHVLTNKKIWPLPCHEGGAVNLIK
jgi:hypothetical protein